MEIAPDDEIATEIAKHLADLCEVGFGAINNQIDELTQAQKNRALFKVRGADLIERLIRAGANPNCALEGGWTPLHRAARLDYDALATLIRFGAQPMRDNEGRTPLHLCAYKSVEAHALLMKFPELVNQKDNSGLAPIFQSSGASFHLFVEAGADLRATHPDGRSLLWFAPPGWAGPLVLAGADMKSEANCGIIHRETLSYADIVALVHAGVEINNSILHALVVRGIDSLTRIQLLLRNGADPRAKDSQGFTALHHAVRLGGRGEIVRSLCAAADGLVDALTEDGRAPLHLVTDFVMARLLVDLGADINTRDADGNTPLHLATLDCNSDLVRFFLESFAYTDIRNNAGFTPAEIAEASEVEPGTCERSRQSKAVIDTLLKQTVTPRVEGKAATKKK